MARFSKVPLVSAACGLGHLFSRGLGNGSFRLPIVHSQRNAHLLRLTSMGIALVIAVVDWWARPYVSLGFLYLFPIMLAVGFLPRGGHSFSWAIIADVTEEQSATADLSSGEPNQQERTLLNNRESEVLRLLVQGTNKEIAAHLNVSESVVKNTLQQLFAKTEVHTRSQLVRVASECYRDLL